MSNSTAVRVSTANYQNTWGQRPRGFGGWVFFRFLNQREVIVADGMGSYSEIKAIAVEKAKGLGIYEIHVGS
jgi:hypothetical protein